MQTLRVYLDPLSPYAALAFWRLPEALAGHSYHVEYVPILFAALLKAHGHKGPAEIPPKRVWTYRQVAWLAKTQGVRLQLPAAHPFNPLPLLRLAWACAPEGMTPSRWVMDSVLAHVWQSDGAPADDPTRLQALRERLSPAVAMDDPRPAQRLRAATDDALARGVFGVPTFEWAGQLFWGQDSLPMLAEALAGDPWFTSDAWRLAGDRPIAAKRF